MEKLCPVCKKLITNTPVCCICRIFDKENVAEFLKNNTAEKGERPRKTKNHAVYGYQSRQVAIKREKIWKAKNPPQKTAGRRLSKAEELIANTLDEIGETAIILKGLA